MKQEKYKKAMSIHADRLQDYATRLHEFVDEMHDKGISYNDIIGMLEVEKMLRFNESVEYVRSASLMNALDDLAELFSEEE